MGYYDILFTEINKTIVYFIQKAYFIINDAVPATYPVESVFILPANPSKSKIPNEKLAKVYWAIVRVSVAVISYQLYVPNVRSSADL